jgi:hypothetical protein
MRLFGSQHPEERLAVGEGRAHSFANRLGAFASERQNVGQEGFDALVHRRFPAIPPAALARAFSHVLANSILNAIEMRRRPGRRKGTKKTGGRKKGSLNKVTVQLHGTFAETAAVCRDGCLETPRQGRQQIAPPCYASPYRHNVASTARSTGRYASPYHHNVASTARSKKR